jgi:membrane fusion protein (multidrug efflux system)
LLSGCKKEEKKAPAEKVINVLVQPAGKKSLKPFIESIGTLYPYEEVTVSSEVDGIIKEIRTDNGSPVSKGQILTIIDDSDYMLEVKRAEASLKQAEATLSNTKLEYQRKEALYREKLVTQQQFDDVATRSSLAEAEVERAKASLALSKQMLSKTRIYSPLNGFVSEKKAERGNYVKNGAPLFIIIQNNPLKLLFSVNEKDVGKIKPGQDVSFSVDAYPDKEFAGKVKTIYPNIEQNTRTLQIEALIPNQNNILKPGLFARVILYTGSERDIILIPSTALLYEGDMIKVFVAEGERARERFVKIGQKYSFRKVTIGGNTEVLEYTGIMEGINEGEVVVTVGQQNLFEGAKIKSVKSSQES